MRILTEPKGVADRQYQALLAPEGWTSTFTDDAVEALAEFAFQVNQTTQNIGARRLYTIMERVLEDLSFEARRTAPRSRSSSTPPTSASGWRRWPRTKTSAASSCSVVCLGRVSPDGPGHDPGPPTAAGRRPPMADDDGDYSLELLNIFDIEEEGGTRHFVCFLEPVLAGAQGIPVQSIVGEFTPERRRRVRPHHVPPQRGVHRRVLGLHERRGHPVARAEPPGEAATRAACSTSWTRASPSPPASPPPGTSSAASPSTTTATPCRTPSGTTPSTSCSTPTAARPASSPTAGSITGCTRASRRRRRGDGQRVTRIPGGPAGDQAR